jgi:hypothetical protein
MLIILQFISCVSSKKVAETRNEDFSAHNTFEFFKIWREIDIARFDSEILNVKIALVPEDKTISEFSSDSLLIKTYDSLTVMIEEKMEGFRELEKMYSDTTDEGRKKIYQNLKSDSTDTEFLDKIANDPYFELYVDIVKRLRQSILHSTFYASQPNFEAYIRNRSIVLIGMNQLRDIIGQEKFTVMNISEKQIRAFKENRVDFIIAFSGSYNVQYSDRARGRVGSENIKLTLVDVQSARNISSATITHFWGEE